MLLGLLHATHVYLVNTASSSLTREKLSFVKEFKLQLQKLKKLLKKSPGLSSASFARISLSHEGNIWLNENNTQVDVIQTTYNTQVDVIQTTYNTQVDVIQTTYNTQVDDSQTTYNTQVDDSQTTYNTQVDDSQTTYNTQVDVIQSDNI